MEIKRMVGGQLGTNCYIVEDDGVACVIDPGDDCDRILAEIRNSILDKIILTHGHFDHFAAAEDLRKKTGAKIYISEKDSHMLSDFRQSLYDMLGMEEKGFRKTSADLYFEKDYAYIEVK